MSAKRQVISPQMKNNNIFINCPFDEDYKGLLNAVLFTVIVLGFNPQVALLESNSAETRIDKIVSLIEKSTYSIHDLSRLRAENKDEYFRLNMPFELGIDYGAKKFKEECSTKKLLILEKDMYEYRIALSDISGMDIKPHDNNGAKIIECVRDWLVENTNIQNVPAADKVKDDYLEGFQVYLLEKAKSLGYKESNYIEKITYKEYVGFIREWLISNQSYAQIIVYNND